MKILLYFESENLLKTSGIGRALKHQLKALELRGIETTTDPEDDYDILHINTFGLNTSSIINKAKSEGKPVVYHAHSTEEDFRNSFILSNQMSPIFKKRLVSCYSQGDEIITPTPYSKSLLESYGLTQRINAISNGIDLDRFIEDDEKKKAFYNYFGLKPSDKVILSVGLYFERKGILDFVEIAKQCPDYKFIWFGYTNPVLVPKSVQEVVSDYPRNVIFPGYVKGAIIEGAYQAANCFFFPSYEETEGIVVLEALASKQLVLVRDIPVFSPWLKDQINCLKGNNNQEFVNYIHDACNKDFTSIKAAGYEVAKSRSLENVGEQLENVYRRVLFNE
ncbi:MAG: glycosyltransferase [Erysipelotrichaceae bacterium]